ncbi:hypothetical protein EY643_16610 [Halioglobus maricola]|uniref:Alginate export domain-containing protein n=1 Tax=Halioglobus maricola TaxID=2601894 RepID=A0A5P9NMY6_9GAMM|nr:hypothetical protein [Halioglobus maricola]QFU77147.1 hypothetical protein EY643_16610 [Halioglobus maricola]
MRFVMAVLFLSAISGAALAELPLFDAGHVKGRWLTSTYPEDSLFRGELGAVSNDQAVSTRLKFGADSGAWQWQADYQLVGQHGDSVSAAGELDGLFGPRSGAIDDEYRWWDLTREINSGEDHVLTHRLDRLHLAYRGEKTVVRFGRQAVSWGNGLIYNPMDFFNPFDPAAVDTEYKVGDDMFYGQYLLDSGNDWQLVNVQRRDDDGDVTSEVSSTALKYHSFALDREFDLLLAQHYDETLMGLGAVMNVGDAVVRGDVVATDVESGWEASLVLNWSYSWVWVGYNVSGIAEYFFNGFGLREDNYSTEEIAAAEDLVARLVRGELFTLGRHYLASSLMVEVTPLVNVTPTLFYNLGDNSALAQVSGQWDLAQNWQILGALNLPVGPSGTEFGGLETGVDGLTLATGPAVFVQVGFYF